MGSCVGFFSARLGGTLSEGGVLGEGRVQEESHPALGASCYWLCAAWLAIRSSRVSVTIFYMSIATDPGLAEAPCTLPRYALDWGRRDVVRVGGVLSGQRNAYGLCGPF